MKRKSEAFSQALVGLFMVIVLLLLGYFTIVVSGVDLLSGRHRVMIRVAFDQVGGLKDRDNVMYRGTKVGLVDHVTVTPSNLVVSALVDENIVLRRTCRATICNLSMLGGFFLKLEEGTGEPIDLACTVVAGETPTDWMEDVRRISRNLDEITSRPEIREAITNFAAMSEKAKEVVSQAQIVMDRVARGEGTVGKLLSDDETVYRDIQATAAEAKSMVSDAKAAIADVKTSLANAQATMDSAKKAFDNISTITDSVKEEQVLADLKAGIAAFRKAAEGFDFKETTAKAQTLAENLNEVAEKIKNGEGTLGKLINNPELYQEVDGLLKDCRQVLDNYRDTTPISTFSSLAIGAF